MIDNNNIADSNIDIAKLQKRLRDFAQIRDWEKFHNPKNLVMAASVETSELVEIFQWMTESESHLVKDNPGLKEQVSHEVADTISYLLRLCDILDIKLDYALEKKLKLNEVKYPVDEVRGSLKKYNR